MKTITELMNKIKDNLEIIKKEDQEKKNSFSLFAGQIKGGPPANTHKKHRPFA